MEKLKHKILETITLLNGDELTILMPKGWDIIQVTVIRQFNDPEYDTSMLIVYFIEQICRVNGEKKEADYYGELPAEEYVRIAEIVGISLEPVLYPGKLK